MTPIDFKKIKNLFILFPGGAGGNHLTNLISTCDEFEPTFEAKKDYHNELLHKYVSLDRFIKYHNQIHGAKAHFGKYTSLEGLNFPEHVETLLSNKKINILCGHWHCFHRYYTQEGTLKRFTNHAWIVMKFPNKGTIAYDRLDTFKFHDQIIEMYDWPFEIGGPEITKENIVIFDTELFFEYDGSEYLRKILRENFGVELPAIADKIHYEWLTLIKKTLKLSQNK